MHLYDNSPLGAVLTKNQTPDQFLSLRKIVELRLLFPVVARLLVHQHQTLDLYLLLPLLQLLCLQDQAQNPTMRCHRILSARQLRRPE